MDSHLTIRQCALFWCTVILGDRLLGLIYLTDKEDHFEFTPTDERVIETLAAYAAVAITNARLYKGLAERDEALTQRNEDLALINHMGASMAGSLEIDGILRETLKRVMEYINVDEVRFTSAKKADKSSIGFAFRG